MVPDLMDGPVGSAVVAAVRARGGVLTEEDFGFASAEWAPCSVNTLATSQGEVTTWATPAPTHGPSLLDAVARLGPTNRSQVEVLREVMRAIGERRSTLADPSGTSMVSAADAEGNVVVVVHSNSFPRFGSGIVVHGYDLVLANRAGRGFTPEPGHINFPSAGRRPATTLHAWAVAGDRRTSPVHGRYARWCQPDAVERPDPCPDRSGRDGSRCARRVADLGVASRRRRVADRGGIRTRRGRVAPRFGQLA